MEDIKVRILNNEYKNIVIVTGAGVSVNSGIPDYRSQSGFFDELKRKLNIENPALLFTRSFVDKYDIYNTDIYKERIKMFDKSSPTITHNFCKYLYDKGLLRRVYTQNIDGLHQKAGLPDDIVVEYHGSLLKNNVVLYGDSIDKNAINQTINDFVDFKDVDLMLVMGTSLQVSPFCAIPNLVNKKCTRVLVDKNPSNCYKNDWSLKKNNIEDMYSTLSISSTIEIGNRKVSLRPQWVKPDKWKDQYIIKSDCDVWCKSIMITDIY